MLRSRWSRTTDRVHIPCSTKSTTWNPRFQGSCASPAFFCAIFWSSGLTWPRCWSRGPTNSIVSASIWERSFRPESNFFCPSPGNDLPAPLSQPTTYLRLRITLYKKLWPCHSCWDLLGQQPLKRSDGHHDMFWISLAVGIWGTSALSHKTAGGAVGIATGGIFTCWRYRHYCKELTKNTVSGQTTVFSVFCAFYEQINLQCFSNFCFCLNYIFVELCAYLLYTWNETSFCSFDFWEKINKHYQKLIFPSYMLIFIFTYYRKHFYYC